MGVIQRFFANLWTQITTIFSSVNIFTSLIDILVVTILVYALLNLFKGTRAAQLFKGIFVLFVIYVLAKICKLAMLSYIMDFLIANALILLAIIFQPELRKVLENAGRGKWGKKILRFGEDRTDAVLREQEDKMIDAVCNGYEALRQKKMGALIVLENQTSLEDLIHSYVRVDAEPSAELIGNLFFEKSPLHDGAVLIRDFRVYAASCILPVSNNPNIDSALGTRHRAAVGLSESSDAIAIVLSEETGEISIADAGVLTPVLSMESLRARLEQFYRQDSLDIDAKKLFQRRVKK